MFYIKLIIVAVFAAAIGQGIGDMVFEQLKGTGELVTAKEALWCKFAWAYFALLVVMVGLLIKSKEHGGTKGQ